MFAATTIKITISITMLEYKTDTLFTHCYIHNAQNTAWHREEI